MRLLILGGTAFLGHALARAALTRGADVTCLARGTNPVPPGARLVRADRDRDDAYAELAGEHWDAVIDVTRQPGHARRATRALRAEHWVLVSSASVYARFDQPEQGEGATLLPPLEGLQLEDPADYGRAKVACERATWDRDGSGTVIRAGLIGGAGDWSARSGYYPWRFAHPTGPDVLAPPDPTFPTAVIDVEDLAAWALDCAERRVHGTFNATGPTTTLGHVLEVARQVAGSGAAPRHVSAEALRRAGVGGWMGRTTLPLWLADPTWRWFATLDTTAARREGLRTRPLADTLAAALAYEERRSEQRPAGLTNAEEVRLRAQLG